MNDVTAEDPTDPVLAGRERALRVAKLAQRGGYVLFGAAVVVFFVGLVGDFDDTVAGVVVACLIAGSVLLLPGILLAYAVKAARRDELEEEARRPRRGRR